MGVLAETSQGMGAISNEDRRKGLDFATTLQRLAVAVPDELDRKLVQRVVHRFRRKYGFSPAEKKDYIVKVIEARGGASIADLVTITGWHQPEICILVKELEAEKRVQVDRVRPAGDKGGRPMIILFVRES